MNYQKDTIENLSNQKDNTPTSLINTFNHNAFSDFVIKKTEKLVTALYMVTDCMEVEDAMKIRLRSLGVDLLSNIHSFATVTLLETENSVVKSRLQITEILSLVGIASTMGFVSEMNANILKKEFDLLKIEFTKYEEKSGITKKEKYISHASYTIDENALDVPLPVYKEKTLIPEMSLNPSRPFQGGVPNDRGGKLRISPINSKYFSTERTTRNTETESRPLKILSILKGQKDMSIKDIALSFTNCSEKTIQRELNDLVLKKKIKKIGEKRWSRYSSM